MKARPIDWRARIVTLVVVAGLGALGTYTFLNLELQTDITHFLPSSEDQELARIAREMADSDLNRSVTMVVQTDDGETIEAAQDLAARLSELDEVDNVRAGTSDDLSEAFYTLYFDRRLGFVESELSDELLAARVHELKQRLVSQTGMFVRQIAPSDPLLTFLHHLEGMRDAQQGGLQIENGQLLTHDGRGVLFVTSRSSPFDGAATRRLDAGIEEALAAVRTEHPSLSVEMSGVHRFALASETTIRADITRISIVSMLGVVLLLLGLFRSFRYLILGTIPLAAGFIAGISATQLLFGRIHGLSLAFGATLIGIAIDYVAHALNHHTLAPSPEGPVGSLRKIMPGLTLGAATTVAGLAGLAWTSFPGIRELAVLTSVGVAVALLATRYLLPPWMPADPRPTGFHRALATRLGHWMEELGKRRKILFALPVVALLISVAGLSQVEWIDDIRALNTLDEDLQAEDLRVRDAVSRMDAGRLVIAWGDTNEEALRRNDLVHRHLTEAVEAEELDGFRSLHSLLWSAEAQRESFDALRATPRLRERLDAALAREQFNAEMFQPFFDALEEDAPEPLTWEEVASSPVGPLVQSFRVELEGDRVAYITLTRGADPSAIEARLEGLEGVRLFDQQRFLQSAYGGFRTRTLEMIAIGLALVFLMVLARYRRLGPALAAFLPAVLAATTSLSVLALAGHQANLMHLTALLLVLSMGVDYGVFMVESRSHVEGPAPTVMSLLVACLSTVLSFGLLAMSANPALRALGLVTGLGVFLSFVLAPTAWLLLGPPKKKGGRR